MLLLHIFVLVVIKVKEIFKVCYRIQKLFKKRKIVKVLEQRWVRLEESILGLLKLKVFIVFVLMRIL